MASGREFEYMKNEAICSICLDFYKEPVTIDCGHNYCRACILQCWGSVRGAVSCPQCRQMFGQRSVRSNRTLSNMVESIRILSMKLESSPNETSVFCQEHEEKLKLFCETEQKVICVVCAMSRDHKYHTVIPIKEAAEIRRQDMQKALETLQDQLAELSQYQRKEEANENEVKTQADSLQRNLESEFSKMQQLMTKEKRGLIQKLRQEEEITLREIRNNKREISNQITAINQITAQIQTKQTLQDTEFLKDIKSIIDNSGIEIKQPTTVAIDLAVGEFNGSLEDRVKERLRKAINPAQQQFIPKKYQFNTIDTDEKNIFQAAQITGMVHSRGSGFPNLGHGASVSLFDIPTIDTSGLLEENNGRRASVNPFDIPTIDTSGLFEEISRPRASVNPFAIPTVDTSGLFRENSNITSYRNVCHPYSPALY